MRMGCHRSFRSGEWAAENGEVVMRCNLCFNQHSLAQGASSPRHHGKSTHCSAKRRTLGFCLAARSLTKLYLLPDKSPPPLPLLLLSIILASHLHSSSLCSVPLFSLFGTTWKRLDRFNKTLFVMRNSHIWKTWQTELLLRDTLEGAVKGACR